MTSDRPAAANMLLDCMFVDRDGDARLGDNETLVSYLNEGAVFIAATGGSRYSFTVSLNAAPEHRICGRSMRVERAGSGYLDRSEMFCALNPPPVIAENGNAILLPLSGAAVVAVALGGAAWRRRRRMGAPQ